MSGTSKSGRPRPGTGGYGRRKLEGKGPTPPAEQRPGHPAQRRAAAAAGQQGKARRPSARSPFQAESNPSAGPVGRGNPAGRGSGNPPAGAAGRGNTAGRGSGNPSAGVSGRGNPTGRSSSSLRAGVGERGSAGGRGSSSLRAGALGRGNLGGRGAGNAHEMVAGRNAVLESLRAAVPAIALHVGPRLDADERITEAIKLAADTGVPVVEAGRSELDRITGGAVHQGLALRVRPYAYAHPDDLIANDVASADDSASTPLVVALDGVTDPRNLGAVVRSVAAFDGNGVLVPARRSAGVTSGAWKASAGALARVRVAQAPNLAHALAGYARAGLFVVGLDASAEDEVGSLELAASPLVLVIGSEGKGLSRLVAQHCDAIVKIPISGAESLNAGVAAGIALYQVAMLRRAPVS